MYAPRAKHADARHAPPQLNNSLFSWLGPATSAKEFELVARVGMDAVVFLRYLRMLRNIFVILTLPCLGVLLPATLIKPTFDSSGVSWYLRMTPQFVNGQRMYVWSVMAYFITGVVLFFIWLNYRAMLRLRRMYFNSGDYQASLHSRSLLLTRIPTEQRTDEALSQLVDAVVPLTERPKATIGRNVRDLPELIEEHEESVKKLEKYLATYLRNPENLPAKRPSCKPSKKDKAHGGDRQVDAIDYLTGHIRELEKEIQEVRQSIDKRNPESFGFASFGEVANAHSVAYAARKKGPQGTLVRLAPRPNDIIWTNLAMTPAQRKNKSFWNGVAMTVITVLYVVPNVFMAVFLTNFGHLAQVWPAFAGVLQANQNLFAVLQGIVAPLIQTLIFMGIPVLFRRMFQTAGDTTKNGRERHVLGRLYGFYVFNNLVIFSIFSAIWAFIAGLATAKAHNQNVWEALKSEHPFQSVVHGLYGLAGYWITWQMQHNLGAAIDLIQVWTLIWAWFRKRFFSPTPRELIELSAPQPFPYADYYNNYLFTATVGLCYATLQPLIVPVTAIYLIIELWFKSYLMQYVMITKNESGGVYWRICVNRLLFGLLLSNVVIALVVGAQGLSLTFGSAQAGSSAATALYIMVPLPFGIWGFKFYCRRAFDVPMAYFSTDARGPADAEAEAGTSAGAAPGKRAREDRVAVKFGHPAMYKRLLTPMVAERSKHLLKQIYAGRLDDDGHEMMSHGYSDVYLGRMSSHKPGQSVSSDLGFEFVAEHDADFANFKKRAEFREEFGGEGELYGRPEDSSRPGTPSTMYSLGALRREESPSGMSSRGSSRTRVGDADGAVYPRGYHATSAPRSRQQSFDIATPGHPAFRSQEFADGERMLTRAAGMGQGTPGESWSGRSTPVGHGGIADDYFAVPGEGHSETSYEPFRRGRPA